MKWEQIETSWAAMARRIRADYPADCLEPPSRSHRGRDAVSASLADRMTAPLKETERKTAAK